MLHLVVALALTTLPLPAIAHDGVFVATLPEKASGFKTLADCEQAIARPAKLDRKARAGKHSELRGSLFNRTAGNTTRCEMVDGEPLIVVTPKGI